MFAKSPLMTLSELSANGIVSRIWSEPGRASPASTRLRRIGCSARRSATVLAWLRRITSVPTSESRFSDCSVPHEQTALLVEHVQARAEVVDDVGDPGPLVDQRAAEPLEGVDRPHDVGLLPVERADELVEVRQQGRAAGPRCPSSRR